MKTWGKRSLSSNTVSNVVGMFTDFIYIQDVEEAIKHSGLTKLKLYVTKLNACLFPLATYLNEVPHISPQA